MTGKMRVIRHETIAENGDPVFVFVFEQEFIIFLFGPIFLKQKFKIMTLPGNMKDRVVRDNQISWVSRHNQKQARKMPKVINYIIQMISCLFESERKVVSFFVRIFEIFPVFLLRPLFSF